MTIRTGSGRRKTRSKLRKKVSNKGKISINNYLHKFNENQRVVLVQEPAIQTGMYHSRFHGKTGVIKGKQGSCYKVGIMDGNMEKILIIHPVHLRKA